MIPFVVFHLVLCCALAAAAYWATNHASLARAILAGFALACVAAVTALVVARDRFLLVQFGTWVVFGYLPVLLLLALWPLGRGRPWLRAGLVAALALTVSVGVDSFLIEPVWLEITHYQIRSEKLDRPVRIVVIADLQADHITAYERAVLLRAAGEKPDLVLFAGDYLQAPWAELQRLRTELWAAIDAAQLRPSLGMFAVRGNVDSSDWAESLAGLGIETVDRTTSFDLGRLRLTCLSMRDSFGTAVTLPAAFQPAVARIAIAPADAETTRRAAAQEKRYDVDASATNPFQIVLGHAPNFALGCPPVDLLVAGHTHGGQVCLPFIGPLITHTRLPRAWAAGMTTLPDGSHLFVSRGIGMERGDAPRMRFCCRPELAVIDLIPASSLATSAAHRAPAQAAR